MINKKVFYLTISSFGTGLITMLQVVNLSTILQFAGFEAAKLSYLWLLPPLTGLISQPIIGLISDNISTKFGRRKPLLLISTFMGTIGIIFLPFAHNTICIMLLIILLDIGANGSAQIVRLLILDLTKKRERTIAFSSASALSGLGAILAGILPWLLPSFTIFTEKINSAQLPIIIKFTFLISAILYVLFSTITLIMVKENVRTKLGKTEFLGKLLFLIPNLIKLLKKLGPRFWKLSYTLFFAWIAIFSVWNYLNIHIAQTIMHMPSAWTDDIEKSAKYLASANNWTSAYMSIVQFSSILFAFIIPILNEKVPIQFIFTLGLMTGSISLILLAFCSNSYLIVIIMVFYGITWATINICPYDMFAKLIHKKHQGYYMGIFNISIVVPQIITGMFLGATYKYIFAGKAFYIILLAGVFFFISSFISFKQYLDKIKLLTLVSKPGNTLD